MVTKANMITVVSNIISMSAGSHSDLDYSIKEQTHIRKQVQEISKLLNEMLPSQDISVTIGGTIHAIHVQSDTDNVHIQHQISDLIHASLKPIE